MDTPGKPETARSYMVHRLIEGTGVTVDEAQGLIALLD